MRNTTIFIIATIVCVPLLLFIPRWWRRWWNEDQASHTQRFLKNSSLPILANLFGKVLDLGFAAITLRALGPTASGAWSFVALITSMYLVTIVNWGLNDLAVREAAINPQQAPTIFGVSVSMRWLIAAVVTPLTILGLWLLRDIMPPLSWGTQLALVLLLIHLWPAGAAAAASASFQAAQRMEIPALVVVVTSLVRTIVGIGVVWWLPDSDSRIAGMAAVALATTIMNAGLLWGLQQRLLFTAWPQWDVVLMRRLWVNGFPLLLNSLLLTVFFRFDAVILRSVAGDAVLGLYDAAYKVIAMTQIIPPYVVGALFPLLAQRAAHQRELLAPLVARAIGVLQWVAWFGVVIVTLMADELIRVLGGKAYLPGAAQALRVLIWYLPLSYTTGVLQYALIAIQRQKTITLAFAIGTIVNIGCNVVLIPHYGALAAAAVTIATEVALMAAVWPTLRAAGLFLPWRTLMTASGGAIIVIGAGFLVRQWLPVPAIGVTIGAVFVLTIFAFYSGTLDNAVMVQVQRLTQRIKTRFAR